MIVDLKVAQVMGPPLQAGHIVGTARVHDGNPRVELGRNHQGGQARARVGDFAVGGSQKRGNFAVLHPAITVDIRPAPQTGQQFMREHAGLVVVPFMGLGIAGAGHNGAYVRKLGQPAAQRGGGDFRRGHLHGLGSDIARTNQGFGVAGVDHQVHRATGQRGQHLVVEYVLRQRTVGKGQIGAAILVQPAVAAVEEPDRHLVTGACGALDVNAQFGQRAAELGQRWRPGFATGRIAGLGRAIRKRQNHRPARDRAGQLVHREGVVVREAQYPDARGERVGRNPVVADGQGEKRRRSVGLRRSQAKCQDQQSCASHGDVTVRSARPFASAAFPGRRRRSSRPIGRSVTRTSTT